MAQTRRQGDDVVSFETLAGVLAMTLTQSVTIVKATVDLLDDRWAELGEEWRAELLHMLRRHTDHIARLLEDFRDRPDVVIHLTDDDVPR